MHALQSCNVPIVPGRVGSYHLVRQPDVVGSEAVRPVKATWFEQKFVMLGTIAIAVFTVAFSVVPVFV